ncbi:MAG: hypothetical protein GDA36_01390 [Rhodobacteraceae bacterium]|nr:hypothetical protein [Paracoccaceae bacterium]
MFGGSFDLAILSGLRALPGLTSGKAFLVVWLYAIAAVCGAGSARLPPAPAGRFVLASPNYRAALHRAKTLLNPQAWRSACPRVVPGPAGADDGRPFA